MILSAQCTDVKVNMVTPALFAAYPDAAALAKAEPAELVDFFAQLERLVANAQCDLVISFSEDAENVPESIRKYQI